MIPGLWWRAFTLLQAHPVTAGWITALTYLVATAGGAQ